MHLTLDDEESKVAVIEDEEEMAFLQFGEEAGKEKEEVSF